MVCAAVSDLGFTVAAKLGPFSLSPHVKDPSSKLEIRKLGSWVLYSVQSKEEGGDGFLVIRDDIYILLMLV